MITNQVDIKNRILESETELLNAFQNCDLNTLEKLIHESALFILPNGLTVSKLILLDNYRSGATVMTSIKASDQKINIIDNNAVVSVNLEMAGKYNDQVVSQQFRYIRVWKLFNDSWKVIAVSGVPLNNK
ncbi:MAG: nuclear transport factor 2 family protein [Bacteroidia bacterium]